MQKPPLNSEKQLSGTDRLTILPTDRHSGLQIRVHATKQQQIRRRLNYRPCAKLKVDSSLSLSCCAQAARYTKLQEYTRLKRQRQAEEADSKVDYDECLPDRNGGVSKGEAAKD